MRIAHVQGNQAPTAVSHGRPDRRPRPADRGLLGESVERSRRRSLGLRLDLDGDSQHDDSTAVSPTSTYTADGNYPASLKVTDDVHAGFQNR
jgi:hypothetical protein